MVRNPLELTDWRAMSIIFTELLFQLFGIVMIHHKHTLGTRGFSRMRREFSVLAVGRSHERRSREKTSGTERCFLPSPLTFAPFYRITFTPIRLKVSDCDHVGRHVKKCPKTHIILSKTSSSLKFIALRAIMTGSHRSSP